MCWRNSPWYINAWLLPLRMLMDVTAALQFLLKKDTDNAIAVAKAYFHFFGWMFSKEKGQSAEKNVTFRCARGFFLQYRLEIFYWQKKDVFTSHSFRKNMKT